MTPMSTSSSDQSETGRRNTTTALPREVNRVRPGLAWAIALAAGVAAGLISWVVGEFAREAFRPQLVAVAVMHTTVFEPTNDTKNAADRKNAALVFALLGGVTGLAMGLAGGLVGRSVSRGVIVGLGAQAVGFLAGAVVSLALIPFLHRRLVPDTNDLLSPILVHGGIWMAIGAVWGAALAVGMRCGRGLPRALVGGCAGAMLASVVFHLFSAGLFPEVESTEPLGATPQFRLFATLCVTVLAAIGAVRGALGRGTVRKLDYPADLRQPSPPACAPSES
jgi:vacuolar-type H+-ATPase subunit I/STV1